MSNRSEKRKSKYVSKHEMRCLISNTGVADVIGYERLNRMTHKKLLPYYAITFIGVKVHEITDMNHEAIRSGGNFESGGIVSEVDITMINRGEMVVSNTKIKQIVEQFGRCDI